MDEANLIALLDANGVRNGVRRGVNIMASCPNSTAHKRGDARPSWGINIEKPHFHGCFGCGFKGTLRTLLIHFGYSARKARLESGEDEIEKHDLSFQLKKGKNAKLVAYEPDTLFPYYPTKRSDAYFQLVRGLSLKTIRECKLMHDVKGNRVIFPWFLNGNLVAITGRTLDPIEAKTGNKLISYLDQSAKRSNLYLPAGKIFNEPLVIVEGETDALKVYDSGTRNVGATTGRLSKGQADLMLNSPATDIVAFGDDDSTGKRLNEFIAQAVQGRKIFREVDYGPMRVRYPAKKLDPAQLNAKEIQFLLSQSRKNFFPRW